MSNQKRKQSKTVDSSDLYRALHQQFANLADSYANISQIFAKLGDLPPDAANGHAASFGGAGQGAAPKKKNKVPVDPLAPKKPFSAYIRFCMDQRETVKLQNPNVPSQEISRLLGTLWNTLPASDREFYESQYREDNEVYSKKLAEYKAGNVPKVEEHHNSYDQDDGLGESPESDEESDDQDGHGGHPFHSGHPHKSKSKSHKSSYNNHSPGGHQGSGSEVNLLKKKKKSHHSSSHFH